MRIPIALATIAIAGCSDGNTSDKSPGEYQLETARADFRRTIIPSYTFRWRESCACPSEITNTIQIAVSGYTEITDATYASGGAVPANVRARLLTIDGVFDTIQAAFDEGADEIDVEYNLAYGYPTAVAIDYDTQIADEELSLTISDVLIDP
ncbi:MAG: DUF6174 domain-containing protein [Kofleriaceae bacterium]